MSTNAEWATKTWLVLVMIAVQRGTIQYGQLAEEIGYTGVLGHMGSLLKPDQGLLRSPRPARTDEPGGGQRYRSADVRIR